MSALAYLHFISLYQGPVDDTYYTYTYKVCKISIIQALWG